MGSRFGAATQQQTLASKMKVLMGLLVGVICVLIGVLIFAIKNMGKDANVQQIVTQPSVENFAPAPVANPIPTLEVLTAANDLPVGFQIDRQNLNRVSITPDKLPQNVFLASQEELVIGKFTKNAIAKGTPLVSNEIVPYKPVVALDIPPGYRAITITVDKRSGVEGWAKPGTRVDVIWTYSDNNRSAPQVRTIVKYVEILSIAGAQNVEGGRVAEMMPDTTVTLLVTEQDSLKVELARATGTLSLVLVSDSEPAQIDEQQESVNIDVLLGNKPKSSGLEEEHELEPETEGVMYAPDPKTGEQVKFILVRGRWKRDTSF